METKLMSKLARLFAAAIAAVCVTVVLVAPAPASAATAVTFCTDVSRAPVQLLQWNGYGWDWVRNGRAGADGCGTFSNTPSNRYLRVTASAKTWDGWLWKGTSEFYTPTGAGSVDVGGFQWRKLCQQCSQD